MESGSFGGQDPHWQDALSPPQKRKVRWFLGLAGYYRQFIPDFSILTAPLMDLVKGTAPKQVWWTKKCDKVFRALQHWLSQEPVLFQPDFAKPFILQTDASDVGMEQCYLRNLGEKNTLFSLFAGSCFCGK